MRTLFTTILIVLLLSSYFSSDTSGLSVAAPDKIKVAIAEDVKAIELAIKGPYKITTIETGEVLKQGDVLWQAKVQPGRYGIHFKTFKDDYFKIYGINIVPAKSPSIYVGKCLYRGTLQIIKTEEGLLTVINVLALEDYVKGVLYHEISHRWPPEAIKAQAVASRTFAIYQAQQMFDKNYYLRADTSSQVYRGVFAEKFRTNKAVEETVGQILMYRGKVLPAFFHADCGGKTEKSSNLWKVSLKPLNGIKCTFCKNSPYFKWKRSIPLGKIKNKIKKIKGRIKSINILSRNSSGRVKKVEIAAGEKIIISAKEFRHALGSKILPSTNFNVSVENDRAYFQGYGWGHGVGMCQWGAFAMAKKKYTYKQILEYYYPGAEVVTLKKK